MNAALDLISPCNFVEWLLYPGYGNYVAKQVSGFVVGDDCIKAGCMWADRKRKCMCHAPAMVPLLFHREKQMGRLESAKRFHVGDMPYLGISNIFIA